MLFPENTQYQAPNNPFRGSLFKVQNREHKEALVYDLRVVQFEPFLLSSTALSFPIPQK